MKLTCKSGGKFEVTYCMIVYCPYCVNIRRLDVHSKQQAKLFLCLSNTGYVIAKRKLLRLER